MKVKELKSAEEIVKSFPVMKELRTDLNEKEYVKSINIMQGEGYRLLALIDSEAIVAVAGLSILTNLYYNRHVWIYDLVTTSKKRSNGYGLHLMQYIEELARKEKCHTIALSSGLERSDTHRFYLDKMGYTKPSYVFKKQV